MSEFGPPHPITYRQEIVGPIFKNIRMTDSSAVVGAGSMGKSRLLGFLNRSDVQKYYLGSQAEETLFLWADTNRMQSNTEWGLYEIMLTSIVEGCDQNPKSRSYRVELNNLRSPVLLRESSTVALRHLELAVHTLVKEQGLKICFLLDEFDHIYRDFPPLFFSNLRSLRDQNKYSFCYLLFLRNDPRTLRNQAECESFYELLSNSILGLGPYTQADTLQIILQLEEKRQHIFQHVHRSVLSALSGGHPGLIQILFNELVSRPQIIQEPTALDTLSTSPKVIEECLKLLDSLPDDEKTGLVSITKGGAADPDVLQRLELKGLYKDSKVFSPVFARVAARSL